MTREQKADLITKQVEELTRNGVQPVATRVPAVMVVVKRGDLEKASALKIDSEVTIASLA